MAETRELILRFTGDPRQLRQTMAQVRAELSQFSQGQVAATRDITRQAQQSDQRRIADTVRAANLRLREEQRAAREVARITAETARQAAAQERIRERAAKQLADVQIREAKRAARELERSIATGRSNAGGSDDGGGGFNPALLGAITGRIPALSGLTSELSAVTSASGGAAASIAAIAAPVALAAAEMAILATVATKVTQGLFDLAKQSAAFQGNLFDMSQQVGVSVETLSALEVLAKTTGGSIETVAASLALFQRNLEDAKDPTSEEAKLLRELGVTATDTEEALRQTLAGLFALGESTKQTDSALQLFGRSGRFINAILKESNGDLDAAIRKFRELGIIVSGPAAKAADEFNDNLALLEFQFRGITATLGNEVIPVVIQVLENLRTALKENKEIFEFLGLAARGAARFIGEHFKGAILIADAVLEAHKPVVRTLVALYESLAAAMQLVTNSVPEIDPNAIPVQPTDDRARAESGLELLQRLQKTFLETQTKPNIRDALAPYFEGLEKAEQVTQRGIALLRQLQTEFRRLSSETKAEQVSAQLLDDQFKGLNATLREQILIVARTIDVRQKQIEVERLAKEAAEQNQREIDAAIESLSEFIRQQTETLRQLRFGDKTAIQEAEEFIALFPKWTGVMKETATFSDPFWLRFNAHIIDSTKRIKEMLDLIQQSAALVPAIAPEGVKIPTRVFDDSFLGLPPPQELSALISQAIEAQGAFGGLSVAMADAFGLGQSSAVAFADTLSTAFSGVAQAVGEAVRAFVLFGTAQGGFRKFAAEVIASIAQMAVVQAIWEAAQGLAMLALTWFTGNPKYAASAGAHFAAAATYGIVAGVAVPLGRVVAGNTFQQPAAGGSGGSGGGFGATGRNERDPIDLARIPARQEIHVIFHAEPGSGFAGEVVRAVVDDVRRNGETRGLITETAGA